jgi:DNA-binding NarL/FixJ family response regulator
VLRIIVVEDHALVREGLVRLLAQLRDAVVVRDCADFMAAQALLDEDGPFDLVLLDLALPGIDGFAALEILSQRFPALPVVVLSAFDDPPTVTRVMNLGASGFIPKTYSGEAVLAALRKVLHGVLFRPDGLAAGARLDDALPMAPPGLGALPAELGLTERQGQVLALMVRGLSNRDIATRLGLSEGTVKIHATAIFKGLGVASRTQALVAAARYGIDFDLVAGDLPN